MSCYLGNIKEDLVPPSHFASSVHSTGAHRVVQTPVTAPPISWINPVLTSAPSGEPSPANPWLAITQAQQEILELRKENQRIMMLQGESIRGKTTEGHRTDLRMRYIHQKFSLTKNVVIVDESCGIMGVLTAHLTQM